MCMTHTKIIAHMNNNKNHVHLSITEDLIAAVEWKHTDYVWLQVVVAE